MMTFLDDNQNLLEQHRDQLSEWFEQKRDEVPIPIYGSVDIRDSGWKVCVVDANHFPAGFNNVAPEDEPHLAQLLKNHILRRHQGCDWVHLYPESHTRNPAYVENVAVIARLITNAGFRVTVGSPELIGHGSLDGLSGPLKLDPVKVSEDGLLVAGGKPCLILLNNDLTGGIVPGLGTQMVSPPIEMGWHRRRKSEHYTALKAYVDEVAKMLGIDPWHLSTEHIVSEDKCLDKENCRIELAAEVDDFISRIKQRYDAHGIDREPVIFVKNDQGTYGLGILTITSGEQLLQLSNRKMKKLSYGKGGASNENFFIQEGVPTQFFNDGPLEPVVYLVDGEAASWFYRENPKKSEMDNLNSPSAHFHRRDEMPEHLTRHADGWHALVAELSMLAMGREMQVQR